MNTFTTNTAIRGSRNRWRKYPISVTFILFLPLVTIAFAANPSNDRSRGFQLVARQHDAQHPTGPAGTPSTDSSSKPSSLVGAPTHGNGTSSSNSTTVIRGPTLGDGDSMMIDPRRPVSRLSMIQPKHNTANPPLFPVGSNIVFQWAFDNQTLVFPPANLTVEVSLTSNPKNTWLVTNVTGTATSVTWSTAAITQPPLAMGFYTVSVYDPKLGKHGVATSGHLMPYSDLQIGLYIPEPYIPRSGMYCETCNAGVQLDPAQSIWRWHLALLLSGLSVSSLFLQ